LTADARVVSLADSLGIGHLLSAILVGRNLEDSGNARAFLSADADKAHNPMLLPDMSEAVEVIEDALENNVPIRIHGDYDVDGVAASALMQRALLALGGRVDTYVPHRLADGYGLGKPAVEKAAADGIGLLITVDCGSGSPE
jgi:single-stranded-DNA-specific exonuclease